MSTIVVTGATGDVGSWLVEHFADDGDRVIGIDLERPDEPPANSAFRAVDLTDQGETWEVMYEADPDAVVHCAALPNPLDDPGTRVFENNTVSTYNTLIAAGRVGTPVVWTSSQAVYGSLYAENSWLPDYLPVDEEHERRSEDPYGTSKICGEEVAAAVARRYDIPVTTIRPATISFPGRPYTRGERESFDLSEATLSGDLWSFVDVRDLARLVELTLDPPYDGHQVFLSVADENYLGRPTTEVIEAVTGELPEPCALEGKQAAFSNAKAKDVLGWEPTHAWQEGIEKGKL